MDKQEEHRETFSIGDLVLWKKDEPHLDLNERLRQAFGEGPFEKYGEGPFTVLGAFPAPLNMCSCGEPFGHCRHSDKRQTEIEAIGHHQYLYISLDGKQPVRDNVGRIAPFSGYWFKKQ